MMGHAFAIHNQFGRLLTEAIYQQELAHRCREDGLSAEREVLIRVRHGGFFKDYHLDLLLGGSAIIEAKVARELIAAHQGQGINYLLLAGVHHGSLINFRPSRVERRFLSTRLTPEQRRRFDITETNWPRDPEHKRIRDCLTSLCADVGLGLDLPLYREAVATLAECPRESVPVCSGSRTIGHLEIHLARPGIALAITSLDDVSDYRIHLNRLLRNTALTAISWINLSLGQIHFDQLKK